MQAVHYARLSRHRKAVPKILPLFDWADSYAAKSAASLSFPARHIARQFRIAPHLAAIIAEIAGYRSEEIGHE